MIVHFGSYRSIALGTEMYLLRDRDFANQIPEYEELFFPHNNEIYISTLCWYDEYWTDSEYGMLQPHIVTGTVCKDLSESLYLSYLMDVFNDANYDNIDYEINIYKTTVIGQVISNLIDNSAVITLQVRVFVQFDTEERCTYYLENSRFRFFICSCYCLIIIFNNIYY